MNSGQGPGPPEGEPPTNAYLPGYSYNGFRVLAIKEDISFLFLSKIVKEVCKLGEIVETVKTGRNSVVIHCTNAETATRLVKEEKFKIAGFNVFIPHYYTTSCGIIFDVDLEFSEQEILTDIDCRQFKVAKVERVKRKESDKGVSILCPTKRMKVYFHGKSIPQYIYINYARMRCEPFISRIVQCRKCWRLGHGKNLCKEKDSKCPRCWDSSHGEEECHREELKCVLCKGSHKSTEENCPERIRQNNIRSAMAANNMSRNEAMMLFPRIGKIDPYNYHPIPTTNFFHPLLAEEEFPPLQAPSIQKHNPKHSQKLMQTQIDIPAHSKPAFPIIAPSKPRKTKESSGGIQRKRFSSEITDDEAIDEAIRRSQKDRRRMEEEGTVPQADGDQSSPRRTSKNLDFTRDQSSPRRTSKNLDFTGNIEPSSQSTPHNFSEPTPSTSAQFPSIDPTLSTRIPPTLYRKLLEAKQSGTLSEESVLDALTKFARNTNSQQTEQNMQQD